MPDLFDDMPDLFDDTPLPAQWHSPTSRAAALAAEPAADTQRRAVLDYLRSRGADGATDEEIQTALALPGNAERPRRISLVAGGHVRDSGTTRPTRAGRAAVVWTTTPTQGA
jgi:hypothetical protein